MHEALKGRAGLECEREGRKWKRLNMRESGGKMQNRSVEWLHWVVFTERENTTEYL